MTYKITLPITTYHPFPRLKLKIQKWKKYKPTFENGKLMLFLELLDAKYYLCEGRSLWFKDSTLKSCIGYLFFDFISEG
jgi:hypothetical protein